jgi:hypothetical protein
VIYSSSHIFKNGDMDLSGNEVSNPLPSVAKLVDTGAGDDDDDNAYHRKSSCSPPNRINGSLIYRGDSNEPIASGFGAPTQVLMSETSFF